MNFWNFVGPISSVEFIGTVIVKDFFHKLVQLHIFSHAMLGFKDVCPYEVPPHILEHRPP